MVVTQTTRCSTVITCATDSELLRETSFKEYGLEQAALRNEHEYKYLLCLFDALTDTVNVGVSFKVRFLAAP